MIAAIPVDDPRESSPWQEVHAVLSEQGLAGVHQHLLGETPKSAPSHAQGSTPCIFASNPAEIAGSQSQHRSVNRDSSRTLECPVDQIRIMNRLPEQRPRSVSRRRRAWLACDARPMHSVFSRPRSAINSKLVSKEPNWRYSAVQAERHRSIKLTDAVPHRDLVSELRNRIAFNWLVICEALHLFSSPSKCLMYGHFLEDPVTDHRNVSIQSVERGVQVEALH